MYGCMTALVVMVEMVGPEVWAARAAMAALEAPQAMAAMVGSEVRAAMVGSEVRAARVG